ncbi:tetratricopeptide repeat protein 8 isoform X1 [Cydia strobilella]|uniref:tetratricopeptide repeat protein 8 isoform X1 n=1 Tax=Cydia strobilella TaxID=1100964 RepID=UPI003005C1D7
MDIDYRIINLYKTKQYTECLSLCATALQGKDDRMLEFIQMRAMTIQAKIAGNGYEEVDYVPQQDELTSTAVAKTPRPGTSFQRSARTAQNIAIEIAFQAQKADDTTDWWWNFSLARCYSTLGMFRKTEDCLRQALKLNKHVSIYLRLIAMYVGLNQPLSALEVCKQGLSVFHSYPPLLLEQARIHDQMGNSTLAVQEYRVVALEDPTNMEAVASIAMFNFYNDQPEIALRYYRRLLATNPPGTEIYNNLALCCLYCNQWDLTLPCFRQALYFSTNPDTRSNIWFNLAHVALSTGDMVLARRCLQVSLATNSENGPARHALKTLDARLSARKDK